MASLKGDFIVFTDIFSDDAFSLIALTAAINNVDHVPDRAGQLAFVGVGEGIAVRTATIEMRANTFSLIQTSRPGAPAEAEARPPKATLRSVDIPQIKLEDAIGAHQVQGVRAFGTTNQLLGVQTVVNQQMAKLVSRHDLTLEYHRLGALRGLIKDADASTLLNLFTLFGITNNNTATGGGATDSSPKEFNLDLSMDESEPIDLRVNVMAIDRYVRRNAKLAIPSSASMWVFCGDNFFDALISRPDVKEVFKRTDEQRVRLGANYAFGAFEFAGVVWENYRGTDDGSTVAIDTDEAVGFLTGVPGLYAEYFAPADFMDTANTIGLPRYARMGQDPSGMNRFVTLHSQQNPLPLCLRPQTLVKLLKSA